MSELPDWLRGVVLLATTATGDYVPVLVDAAGQINVLVRGQDAAGTTRTVRVDSLGQLYAVLRGAGGVDVAVDASGFITAVLKGAYAGTLHTIGVDADGRLEAYILDAEDQWGIARTIGCGDLACRLGALQSWDWRGNVIRQTDFSLGLGDVVPVAVGTGAATALDPVYWASGGYSLKLTAGSDSTKRAGAILVSGSNPAARLGAAFRFSMSIGGAYAYAHVEKCQGAGTPMGIVTLDIANLKLRVCTGVWSWADVATVAIPQFTTQFCWLKLVIDAAAGKYARALWNDHEYDLSAYSCPTISSPYNGAILTEFDWYGPGATNPVAYLDAIVATVNEPPNA